MNLKLNQPMTQLFYKNIQRIFMTSEKSCTACKEIKNGSGIHIKVIIQSYFLTFYRTA